MGERLAKRLIALEKLYTCITSIRDDQISDSMFGGNVNSDPKKRERSNYYTSWIAKESNKIDAILDEILETKEKTCPKSSETT